jgi:1-acyl-sn-glycerol-3-phosphate acyltransferase
MSAVAAVARALGRRARSEQVQPPDPKLLALGERVVGWLERYFRASVIGLENVPRGPALLVGNHNAGITFIEPFLLGRAWHRFTQGEDPLYFLVHDVMLALPLLGSLLAGLGAIRASHETAAQALRARRKVMVFPGGNFEAFRRFSERHRVTFGGKTGFVKLALRERVDIVPVLSIGGHETFFVLRRGMRLAGALHVDKLLRSESFPLFLGLPWGLGLGPIFHLPLPSKTLVEVGRPISLEGFGPQLADDPKVRAAIAQRVQFRLQEMMDRRSGDRRWPVLG